MLRWRNMKITALQLLIVATNGDSPGVLLEIEDVDSGWLYRKLLPAAPQAVDEATTYLELTPEQADFAVSVVSSGYTYTLADCRLQSEYPSLRSFANFRKS